MPYIREKDSKPGPKNRPGPMSESPGRMARAGERTRNAAKRNRPGASEGPGRMTSRAGRRGVLARGDRQSVPWREEEAQGTLAFRDGYSSFGASFTACPRLATTGMVMALAGQASTQALQRVQSASVRSP